MKTNFYLSDGIDPNEFLKSTEVTFQPMVGMVYKDGNQFYGIHYVVFTDNEVFVLMRKSAGVNTFNDMLLSL